MRTSWIVIITALAAAAFGLLSNVVAGMIQHRLKPWGTMTIVMVCLGVLFGSAAIAAVISFRTDLESEDAKSGTGPDGAPDFSRSPQPGKAEAPTPATESTKAKPGRTEATGRTPAPAQNSRGTAVSYTVTPKSSRNSQTTGGSKLEFRFWAYEGSDEIGAVRYASGGYAGQYGWAPSADGKDCGAPYVTYIFSGIPVGRYGISAFVPDDPALGDAAEYSYADNQKIINQAANRGKWVTIGSTKTTDKVGFQLTISQPYESFNQTAGCAAGSSRVAFDAIRLTKSG